MKALLRLFSRRAFVFVGVAITCSLLMSTAHAVIPYVDICGTVTVNGYATSNVVVVAWRCSDDTPVMPIAISDGSISNNYHLLASDPDDHNPSGVYVPMEVYLTFSYEDCPAVVITCEEVAAGYELASKPTFDVDIQCLGGGGGHTKGFWQNKNGQALIGGDDIQMLNDCCLRNEDGSNADFANKRAFKAWLKKARAKNMAYMLSAQLAAMKLNVAEGFVGGGDMIYGPGCDDEGADYISINDLMAAADDALCEDGTTVSGDENRDHQECLKSALDDANNNLNFVQL